jgi:hypothetical protein
VEVSVISSNFSLDVGESTVLVCIGLGLPSAAISWSYNGSRIVNTSQATIYPDEDVVRGGIAYTQSLLQLCRITAADAGGYTCTLSNGLMTDEATTQLTAGISYSYYSQSM